MLRRYDKIKNIDKVEVEELLKNESNLDALYNKYNFLSRKELIFKGIKKLEVGTVYPSISSLGLSGIVVKGYNVEINPRKFYFSSFAGKADNYLFDTISQVKYKKSVASFGVGYGSKNESHIHFIYLFSKEKGNTLYDSTSNIVRSPFTNHVLLADIGGLFFHKLLYVGNETSYSILTANNETEGITKKKITDFAQKTFFIAFIPATHTRLKGSVQYTGNNYITLNTPFLLKDRIIVEASLEQQLLKNKVNFNALYKFDLDSVSRNKISRDKIHSLNLSFGLNIPKYPYLQVSYIPTFVLKAQNPLDHNKINYSGSVVFNSGYNFSLKKGKITSTVQVS
jgi:hypothetical protein